MLKSIYHQVISISLCIWILTWIWYIITVGIRRYYVIVNIEHHVHVIIQIKTSFNMMNVITTNILLRLFANKWLQDPDCVTFMLTNTDTTLLVLFETVTFGSFTPTGCRVISRRPRLRLGFQSPVLK